MTEQITSEQYFFAAFKNPFESPTRIGVDSQKSKQLRDREIKALEDSDHNVPGHLKGPQKRMMLMFLIYIVATATIIPLIVLTCIAYSSVKEVQAATDAAAANNSPERQKKLHDVRMLFDPYTGYSSRTSPPPPAGNLSRSTSSSSLSITRSNSNSSFSSSPLSPAIRHSSFSSTRSEEAVDNAGSFESGSHHQQRASDAPASRVSHRTSAAVMTDEAASSLGPRQPLTAQQSRNRSYTLDMYDPAFSNQPSVPREFDADGFLLPISPPTTVSDSTSNTQDTTSTRTVDDDDGFDPFGAGVDLSTLEIQEDGFLAR